MGRNFLRKSVGESKMRSDFFIFFYSLLAIMVTDTAFKKYRLRKLVLENILPDTSKNWPYHTDLLVFCLEFKLLLVCEYLNYCYNITNDCWTIPEKHTFFKKKTWIFEVCHFILGNSGQNKASFTFGNSVKLCYTPCKFQGQKPRLMKMQHFLITPKNPAFTLGNSGQNKALLLQIQ